MFVTQRCTVHTIREGKYKIHKESYPTYHQIGIESCAALLTTSFYKPIALLSSMLPAKLCAHLGHLLTLCETNRNILLQRQELDLFLS